jgi:hypothetical protein
MGDIGNSGAAERFNVHNRLVERSGTCGNNVRGKGLEEVQ